MPIYLYVKTHRKTGLKYLGKTKSVDPYKYKGSGIDWTAHLKIHGNNCDTEILKECETNQEINHWGKFYSNLWNVASSPRWANRIPETGGGSIQTEYSIQKHKNTKKINGTLYSGVNAMRSKEIQIKAGINSRKKYKCVSPTNEEYIIFGIAQFCKEHKLDQGTMSAIAHHRRQLKTHKGWTCELLPK